jgi:AraC-like DNA-binding protein
MGRSISNRRPARFEKWVEFHGTWMVPPHQGMWIPGGVRHSIAMLSQVATRSVYLDQRAARGMPRQRGRGRVAVAARCRRFIERPTAQDTIDLWSRALGLSRRTFTRLFRQETGLTFSAWQRRACLLSAVPRLLGGDAVTTIAFDLDYSSPAAFTTMFKKLVGTSPHAYRRAAS